MWKRIFVLTLAVCAACGPAANQASDSRSDPNSQAAAVAVTKPANAPTFASGDIFVIKGTDMQSGAMQNRTLTLTYQGQTDKGYDFLATGKMDNGQEVTGHMIFAIPDMGIVKDETRYMDNIPNSASMPFPLAVGGTSKGTYQQTHNGVPYDHKFTLKVEKVERIHVDAGDFDCYRIAIEDKIPAAPSLTDHQVWWYSPDLGFFAKMDSTLVGSFEVVSFKRPGSSVAQTQ